MAAQAGPKLVVCSMLPSKLVAAALLQSVLDFFLNMFEAG